MNYPFQLLYDMYTTATGKGYDIVAATTGKTEWKSRLFYKLLNSMSYLNLSLSTENVRSRYSKSVKCNVELKGKSTVPQSIV